ncbi:di-N-acetylchitobiase-like [Lineus longissimus]|uniref:di-N-acetylchitobiase-like n=1 Tax=Lineus longissimus TaxID=88925 RepID=UPI00315DDCCF
MGWLIAKVLLFLLFYVHCLVHFVHGVQTTANTETRQSGLLKQLSGHPSTEIKDWKLPNSLKYQPKATCPCDDPKWCDQIEKTYEKELFVFATRNDSNHWMKFDWSKITTVVLFGFMDHKLVCYAHKHGARAVTLGNFPIANLTNLTNRTSWVKTTVSFIQDNYLDGVNFDIEEPIAKNDTRRINALTALVAETSGVLKRLSPHYQITFDIAYTPWGGRHYDYKGLSQVTDFQFIMAYDEHSPGPTWSAGANSDFTNTFNGIKNFVSIGIKLEQLVLGLPWYGYDYECITLTKDNVCTIPHVPFRGINCSDAAGRQVNSFDIIPRVDTSVSGRLWDDKSLSPYFNYKDAKTGKMHQVWYDDPVSLKLKYDYAVQLGMRGVGMWHADSLDYTDTAIGIEERIATWAILPDYGKV